MTIKIGAGAGLCKDGKNVDQLFNDGFDFVEVGSLTLNPQKKIFPLKKYEYKKDHMYNRVGLKNDGFYKVYDRILQSKNVGNVGISISPSHEAVDRIIHYGYRGQCYEELEEMIAMISKDFLYICINLTSPNMSKLNYKDQLLIFKSVIPKRRIPILIKSSYATRMFDSYSSVNDIIDLSDGFICANSIKTKKGGLTGKRYNNIDKVEALHDQIRFDPECRVRNVIGVGGIWDYQGVQDYVNAGATAVQLVTSYLYDKNVVKRIKNHE